jgi:hypothetical protein
MVGVDLTTKSEIIKASDKLRSSEKLKKLNLTYSVLSASTCKS